MDDLKALACHYAGRNLFLALATHPWVFIDAKTAKTGGVLKEFVVNTADEEVAIP